MSSRCSTATRAGGDGAVRMTSEHLAQELPRGLSRRGSHGPGRRPRRGQRPPVGRASLVEPGLVAVRRALMRLLGRPIGLSGSGPTFWTLYPSVADAELAAETVRAAVDAGTIPAVGEAPPAIIATTSAHADDRRPTADEVPTP